MHILKILSIHADAAKETNTELWVTGLATGHGGYRCPTQDEFRWQLSTSVAHGAKGLFYWFFYAENNNFNYRMHPINELNERTDTFRWCSAENRIFQMKYGALFTQLDFDKVYHIHKAYGGVPLLSDIGDEYIAEVRSYDEDSEFTPAILSRFTRESDPDKYYYAVVNNSVDRNTYTYIKFAKDVEYYGEYWSGGWDRIQLVPDPEKWKETFIPKNPIKKSAGEETFFCCAPGQIWVFVIGK